MPHTNAAARNGLTQALYRLGLISLGERVRLTPLAGGVSSDIFKVETSDRVFVVKRALPKLRVRADWHAPIERSTYEVRWLEAVGSIVPDAVPRVFAKDSRAGLFAMEYFDPLLFRNWKAELAMGHIDLTAAADVGRRLAAIHSKTARVQRIAEAFSTDAIFHAIRLEPYLEATAQQHPAVSDKLLFLAQRTLKTKRALVHGDVSPKNILLGPRGPLFLDAECAWFGDPAFDIAFCLNHLLLKCLLNRSFVAQFLTAFDALAESYFSCIDWETRADLEARAGQLLPALLLARIDGKSPVEYVNAESDRDLVRKVALPLIAQAPSSPAVVKHVWVGQLKR